MPQPRGNVIWVGQNSGMAGWGKAAVHTFSGPDRFRHAQEWFDSIAKASTIDDTVRRPGTGLTAFGTFSFSDESADVSTVIVPAVIRGWDADGAWETTISQTAGSAATSEPATPIGDLGRVTWGPGELDEDRFVEAVAETVDILATGEVKKVVIARDISIVSEKPMDERLLTARLARAFPSCWTFCIEGLTGATPEMLASVRGGHLKTRVLAGSWPTSGGHEAAEYALRSSAKDIAEHRYASDSVLHAIDLQASGPVRTNGPTILRLPNVVHLSTDFEADLAPGWTGLTAAGAMHPTAAVGGTPTDRALEVIARIEGLDRGRYAAPVGWMDAAGNADWALALRCAQLDADNPHQARAFAGGGVMDRSVPQQELAETEAKFSAVLRAFEPPSA
ncbi:chorismate-binding protein [Flaviflexus huanghaiensis]|uniref:chorismate-binding protein n=1 Tax=Flaviflexus huanghaiensis TaxID=1111473 RepID=UPI0015F885A9